MQHFDSGWYVAVKGCRISSSDEYDRARRMNP